MSGRRWWERTQACGSSSSPSHPLALPRSGSTLHRGYLPCAGAAQRETHPRAPSHTPGAAQEETQPGDSQFPPVRGTGVELGHCRCVVLFRIPHKSRAASALAAAAPAPRPAFMGEEAGGNLAFWVACAAAGPEFLRGQWHGPVINTPGLFAGKGRQRGWVTPHFLPFLEAAHSERDAGALITGCFHNTRQQARSRGRVRSPLCRRPSHPACITPWAPACPASVSPLRKGGNTAPSVASPSCLQEERECGCVSLQGVTKCVGSQPHFPLVQPPE